MKHIHILLLVLLVCTSAMAQCVNATFHRTSLSKALLALEQQTKDVRINFIYNELEDFTVTTTLNNVKLEDALHSIVGFYPIQIARKGRDYYLQCVQKQEEKVTGRILDENGQPLEFANIALFSPADSSFINGGVSNAGGDFVIPCNRKSVLVKVSFVGYQTQFKQISGNSAGTIRMRMDAVMLKSVKVKGKLNTYTNTQRGYKAKVQGTPLEDMGTAGEVIKHLPMVMGDGSVAGHGTPEIYINNKKVRDGSELERLKATDALQAEVITVPGPEYSSDVRSVIRIKTIRQRGEGLSGNFNGSYRQGRRASGSESAKLNWRTPNGIDLFTGIYFSESTGFTKATASDQLKASSVWDYTKRDLWLSKYNSQFGTLGVNWEINDRHSVGITYEPSTFLSNSYSQITSETETFRDGISQGVDKSMTKTNVKPRMNHSVNAYYSGEIGKWRIDFNADYYHS